MDDASRAYLAGFFDGEGTVGIYRSRGRHTFHTQVVQNQSVAALALFARWQEAFGGSVGAQPTASGGLKLNWQLNGDNAAAMLASIYPFLTVKREQVRVALLWHERRPRMRRGEQGRAVAFTCEDRAYNDLAVRLLAALKRPGDLTAEIREFEAARS